MPQKVTTKSADVKTADDKKAGEPTSFDSVVGRGAYDATVTIWRDTIALFGRVAPYIVIAALIVFGNYHFTKLNSEKLDAVKNARIEALAENEKTIKSLKDQVLADANAITGLQSSNVDVIVKQIKSQQTISAIMSENIAETARLMETLYKSKAELAQKEQQQSLLEQQQVNLAKKIAASESKNAKLEDRAGQIELTARVATHLLGIVGSDQSFVPTKDNWQIAERYEGGAVDHVGRDVRGNYFYGIFRIRGGKEMASFIEYLSGKDAFTAQALKTAGGETGSTIGNFDFTTQWQKLSQNPGFATQQRDFITENGYSAASKSCRLQAKLDLSKRSVALQSVMWAVAVQHGSTGAGRMCREVMKKPDTSDDRQIIDYIYEIREKNLEKNFPDMEPVIYRLLRLRYKLEKDDAYKIFATVDKT